MDKEMFDSILLKLEKDLNDDTINYIQGMINNCDNINNEDYKKIIDFIFKSLNINLSKFQSLFEKIPYVSIVSLKKILKIHALSYWKKYKEEHKDLFLEFSKNICKTLDTFSYEDTIKKYEQELMIIQNVSKEEYIKFLLYLKGYKESLLIDKYKYKDLIKDFTRKFNAKFKEIIISNYIDNELNKYKSDFSLKGKSKNLNYLYDKKIFFERFFSYPELTNHFKKLFIEMFDIEILNDSLKDVILNMLNNEDYKNFDILPINIPNKDEKNIENIQKQRNRFYNNFLVKINKEYNIAEKEAIVDMLVNDIDFAKYSHLFDKNFYSKYIEFKQVYKDTHQKLIIKNNNIIFDDEKKYDPLLISSIKEKINIEKKYYSIKKSLYNYYSKLSEFNVENLSLEKNESRIFDDDNYYFNNNVKMINVKMILEILKSLNIDVVEKFDDDSLTKLKNILFDSGIMGVILLLKDNKVDISNIINNFEDVKKYAYDKNNNINFDAILKRSNLFDIVDDFSLSLLGSEVAEKLVNNRQFLQNHNDEVINERLEKADYLLIKSDDVKLSSIPYLSINKNNIKIERYNNNDVNLLTSGIDTNTCFSLCSNDNDYVFYSILNKNGIAFKITDNNNNFIGRASAHLMGNTLFINGIRTYDEKDYNLSKEKALRNKNIFEAITTMAQRIIEETSQNNIPIDYVVCNKAGILESSLFEFNDRIIDENIYKRTSVDIYNDDWKEFLKDGKNYLYESTESNVFTTDYGHFPAILLASRDNKFLNSIRDISIYSEDEIYERPRKSVGVFYNSNIDFNDIEKINSINAKKYYYDNNCDLDYCRKNYKTKNIDKFYKIYIGEDWYCLFNDENNYEIVMTHVDEVIINEINEQLKINISNLKK